MAAGCDERGTGAVTEEGRNMSRDLIAASLGALVAGLIVATYYQVHRGDFDYDVLLKQHAEYAAWVIEGQQKVPIVYCVKDVPAGNVYTYDALETKTIDIAHCPANVVDCVWVAVGRISVPGKKKGDPIFLSEFGFDIPSLIMK